MKEINVNSLDDVVRAIKNFWYGDDQEEQELLGLVFENRKDIYFKDFPEIIELLRQFNPDKITVLSVGGVTISGKNSHVISVYPCYYGVTSLNDKAYWNIMYDEGFQKEHLDMDELKKELSNIKIRWKYEKD